MAQNTPSLSFCTPVGRMVQGDVFKGNDKDRKGVPLVVKTGPNAGQPMTRFVIALAIEKFVRDPQTGQTVPNPEEAAFYSNLYQFAMQTMGSYFNAATGQCLHPRFTFKRSDGDGVDNDGKQNKEKPGFAGCWVYKFTTSFAPRVVDSKGNPITAEDAIKRGYYIRVLGNAKPNTGSDVPGLYLNHEAVELSGYGEEIRGGIDAAGAFAAAGQSAYMPAGMTQVPAAGAMSLPSAGGALVPTAAAQGFTLDQWKATGQTEDQLVAAGMFVRQQPAPQMPGAAPQIPVMPGAAPQMPVMPGAAPQMPVMPGAAPQMPVMPGAAPQMPVMPGAAPQMPVPNHGFVQNAIAQQLVPTALAQNFTLDQWKATGQTEDQLVAAGMFVRQ